MDKTPEAKSNFEKQVEDLAEKVTDQNGLLQMLIQKLDEQSKVMEQQQRYIEDSLKMRDRHLTEHLRSQFEVAVAVEAPKRTGRGKPGFFSTLVQNQVGSRCAVISLTIKSACRRFKSVLGLFALSADSPRHILLLLGCLQICFIPTYQIKSFSKTKKETAINEI